ncbi:hypothetical protein B0H10DRAFT_574521 [Mycena sp. CBHHK59/15]|nr:hypothetical protein B0H10DRAFT_574521 [Mycena sp. CBHHK59/15]
MTEPEPKKPASRAKAKTPLPPSDNELDDADDDDDMGMEQYLPPPPAAVKSKSKPPSKVDEVIQDVREPKGPRGRKPSSRSTSKSILSKSEAAVLTTEVVEEEPELYEPAAPPPARTRKASSRSGSTIPPVARGASTSTTATLKSKAKRDPSPSPDLEENYDMDVLDTAPDPTLDESVHVAPAGISRQASKSKPASNGVVPSSLQTSDAPTTTSRKPVSKTTPPAPAVQKPRSMSQSQLHGSKAKKDTEQEYGGSSDSGDGLKVVDISTDEDEPKAAPKVKGKGKTKSKEKKAARNNLEEKRQVSSAHTSRILRSEEVADDDNDDVEMAEVEETMRLDPDPLPATPPRTAPAASSVLMDESSHRNHVQASPEGFAFIPPLATDPFVNLEDLSEAEQDMTVEEWIRYQMGIEYDRFKRDGERQLSMFERRAEEVRQAIETL